MRGDEFDTVERASRELEEHIEDIDLDASQAVCEVCHLVYWLPLGFCSNCAAHN